MYSARKLKWGETHNKWNDIKFPEPYQQYLQDVFGITITEGRVIWGHVVEVTFIPEPVGPPGGPGTNTGVIGGKAKKVRKKIKLIFIMGDIHKEQTKIQSDISPAVVTDIQNHIEEQLQTKITLSDVQVIKG